MVTIFIRTVCDLKIYIVGRIVLDSKKGESRNNAHKLFVSTA